MKIIHTKKPMTKITELSEGTVFRIEDPEYVYITFNKEGFSMGEDVSSGIPVICLTNGKLVYVDCHKLVYTYPNAELYLSSSDD